MTERNRIWRSRVKILDGSSRKKLLSRPAMAWGSQYSSVRSRSTSPSCHGVGQCFRKSGHEIERTSIKLIFQALYDSRAPAESIDTLLLVSLHFLQILDTAKDDCRKTSDFGNLKRLLQRYAKHRAVDVCMGNRFLWAYRSNGTLRATIG